MVRIGSNTAVAAAGCPTPALGRRLALAISMNERLLIDVVHSKSAVPVSAVRGHYGRSERLGLHHRADIPVGASVDRDGWIAVGLLASDRVRKADLPRRSGTLGDILTWRPFVNGER